MYGSRGPVGRHSDYLIPGPGIIVGRKGTVGAVEWSHEPFWPIDTTYYVEPKGDTDLRWVYWCLSALPLNKLDSSTGVPGLNRYDAYALRVNVPPLPERRRIARILDTADDAIQHTERVIAKLKAVKVGLLNDLLTRGLDQHGHLRDPEAHPEQFKDSRLGRIPTGWHSTPLSEICAIISRGKAPTYVEQSNVLAIGQRCVQEPGFDPSAARPQDERRLSDALLAVPGDVLLNSTGTGTIGRACVFDGMPQTYVVDGHVTLLRTHSQRADGRWLNALFQLEAVQQYFASYCYSGSTNQIELSRNRLEASRFAVPPAAEQRRIGGILDAADDAIRQTENELAKLRQVKLGLMDDLLSGKVRVEA